VKPDGVAFGGCGGEPFGVLSPQLSGGAISGTSFAAPLVLRSAASVIAQLGDGLAPLAVRALLIHRAQARDDDDWKEVGWGRFEADSLRLITCDDNEALVVFQGVLPVGEHLRAPVPIQGIALTGDVVLSATLVISPEVDPEFASTYTRSGLEVSFRPHSGRYTTVKPGKKPPKHAKTRPFFSSTQLYGKPEMVLREGGHKWERCLRNEITLKANALSEPCFDIYYHHRSAGTKVADPKPIPYALVVALKASEIPDLYDRVVRAYAQVLVAIQPRTRIQVRT
jgi:hypothetical protein